MVHVLIVCTGNTCRSPMGEGILRSLLGKELESVATVSSAGTGAMGGVRATAPAVQTCAEGGIDIGLHESRPLTADLVRRSDLILGMEPQHVEYARKLAPDVADRVHLITERGAATGTNASSGVLDPLGGTADEYRDTFNRIRSHLLGWLPFIREAIDRSEGVRRSSDP